MKPRIRHLLLLLCTLGIAQASEADAPTSERVAVTRTFHGRAVPEPYAWLEKMDSPKVAAWARAQDRYARSFLQGDPLDELRRKILAVTRVERFMAPLRRGNRYFYVSFDGGATQASAWLRNGFDGKPVLLVGPGTRLDDAETLHRQIWPSPDGRRLAYGVTHPSSRWMELCFLDLASGEVLPDRLQGLVALSSAVSWATDSSGVYYERFSLPPPAERSSSRLHDENLLRHTIGANAERDAVVYDSIDPENEVLTHTLSDDGRFLVLTVRDGREIGNRVLAMDTGAPDAGFRELLPETRSSAAFVGSRDEEIWLQTDLEAPRGQILAVHWDDPGSGAARLIVPEHPTATIDTWVGARAAGKGIVVGYREDSRLYFAWFGADGTELGRFEPPNLSSVWTGLVGRQGDESVFFTVSNFADPGTVFRLDLRTGEKSVFQQPALPYEPGKIVVEQRFYRSEGRDRVPIFLAYHEDTPPNGSRPVMMYGYGFGGWIAAPWFRPHLPQWFMAGGAFALPAMRGGGEYGDAWHRSGTTTAKNASIDDFLAAAQWLVDAGLAKPSLLVAETNSAGGPVVGAAIVRRPDLFGAAVLAFPLLDMLSYEKYTHAGRWLSELGSVADPEQFSALASYSPPHNVMPETCYPPVLLLPGERDEVTPPVHAYKFTAALQHADECGNRAWMRMSWDSGHAYGATPEETAATLAAQLAFIEKVLQTSP